MAYVFMAVSQSSTIPSPLVLAVQLLLFLLACFCIAGFGHLFLDAFDRVEDRMNGKSNGWLILGEAKSILILILLFVVSWIILSYLSHSPTVKWLVAAEYLLFVIYAMPPFRFKERGMPGIIVDGIYGYVMPSLVAWAIFSPDTGGVGSIFYPICLVLWLLPKGIRHILRHQYYDIDDDTFAGVSTFSVRHGRVVTLRLIQRLLLPIEVTAFVIALTVLSWPVVIPVIGFIIFCGWEWRVLRFQWLQPVPEPRYWKPIEWSEWLGMRILTTYSELLLPLFSLLALILRHPSLWPLSMVYLLISGWPLKLWWNEVSPLFLKRFNDVPS